MLLAPESRMAVFESWAALLHGTGEGVVRHLYRLLLQGNRLSVVVGQCRCLAWWSRWCLRMSWRVGE